MAIDHGQHAVALHRTAGHQMGQVHALRALARAVQQSHGDIEAAPLWREAEAIHARISAPDADADPAGLIGHRRLTD